MSRGSRARIDTFCPSCDSVMNPFGDANETASDPRRFVRIPCALLYELDAAGSLQELED